MSLSRFIYQSNRQMPTDGNANFGSLKKSYSKGIELEGKTLGIIGLGRIGQEAAKIGLGLGMNVVGVDPFIKEQVTVTCKLGPISVDVEVDAISMDEMLGQADFITMHIPFTGAPALGAAEFSKMKKGVFLVDAARGGTIDEDALLDALDNGTVAAAGLDVFINEPTPRQDILSHAKISLTPHIGASTLEAQEKIGTELASKIIEVLKG
jgi:D-3-phosphoglycerate dehydrogenase